MAKRPLWGARAANSLCATSAFFCSDDHLPAWHRQRSTHEPGFRLSIEEALEAGPAFDHDQRRRESTIEGGRFLDLRGAAIHKQFAAVDEAAVVGGEEQRRACDLGGLP